MEKISILNSKEIKNILKLVKGQWGAEFNKRYAFLMNNKNKVFLVNTDISRIDLNSFRINNLGLYFGEIINNNDFRLSIEGSQIIGPLAKKNILELSEEEAKEYMKGTDLDKKTKDKGFLIIKHKNNYLGTGKSNGEKIYNYTPKERRINS